MKPRIMVRSMRPWFNWWQWYFTDRRMRWAATTDPATARIRHWRCAETIPEAMERAYCAWIRGNK